jgi:hypothetical protein
MMPLRHGGLDAGRCLAVGGESSPKRDGIQPVATPTVKQDFPRGFVLDKKKQTMKLNKDVIIATKTKHGEEVFVDMRNMENISQTER